MKIRISPKLKVPLSPHERSRSRQMQMLTVHLSPRETRRVESLGAASLAVREYLEGRGLGASEWYGPGVGDVTNAKGLVIAHISYNGRIWINGEAVQ